MKSPYAFQINATCTRCTANMRNKEAANLSKKQNNRNKTQQCGTKDMNSTSHEQLLNSPTEMKPTREMQHEWMHTHKELCWKHSPIHHKLKMCAQCMDAKHRMMFNLVDALNFHSQRSQTNSGLALALALPFSTSLHKCHLFSVASVSLPVEI